MKRILLAVISFSPLLAFGQSMKISPKQIEPGLGGQVIVTRNNTNTLDSLKWADISAKPTNLERTSNKVTNLNSPDNVTYPTTQSVANNTILIQSVFNNAFGSSASSTTDANNIKNNSVIFCNSVVQNIPTINVYGGVLLTNFGNSGNNGRQDFISWDNQHWNRAYNGSWSTWTRMADQNWVNSQGFLKVETDPIYTSDKTHLLRTDLNPTAIIYNAATNSVDLNTISNNSIVRATWVSATGQSNANSPFNDPTGGTIQTFVFNNPSYATQLGIQWNGRAFVRGKGLPTPGSYSPWKELLGAGDRISLFNNDVGYITSASIPAAQTLSLSGQNLSLSGGGGTVTIPNTTYTAGTGLSLTGTTFTNTAPDQVVSLTSGTGISVAGTYPNFTVTNTAPNVPYTLPMASASVLGGIKIGSRLSIASGVLSADNMIQNLSLSGQTLSISGGNNVTIPATDITTALNANTGILTTESSTGNDDSIQLLTRTGGYGYLEPVGLEGINTTGGFAAMAQTVAFNSTYIEINSNTYTYYIVAGGNPSGGNIKLTDPAGWHGRIIRIINTSGAIGTFINFSIRGISSSSVTSIPIGGYIVIQSIEDGSGTWVWAQIGGNY